MAVVIKWIASIDSHYAKRREDTSVRSDILVK